MFKQGTTSGTLLFNLIRLSPLATSIMLGAFSAPTDLESSQAALGRLLVLSVIIIVWSMAESTVMLWHRAKQRQSESSRGYGFVTVLMGIALLALLNVFRARTSQSLFLLTLAMISVRGMSRAGWEQGRPRVAFGAAIAGATLLSVLSFFAVSPEF
jgi:FtsH-binding integral membrane protein